MKPIVSVVIPCYNCEKHIASLAKTLFAQTYPEWEAVCVDDGSTDRTAELLINYSAQDRRIRYFHQRNRGAAKAREYGVEKASGDYITFLDSDDTLLNDALGTFVTAFDEKTDVVISGFNIIRSDGTVMKKKRLNDKGLSGFDYLKNVLCGRYGWELWAKMYRKRLFDHPIRTPDNIRIGEDAVVFVQLICNAGKVKLLSSCLYNYFQFDQSASHVRSMQYAEETLQAGFFIESILKKYRDYACLKREIDAMFLLFLSNSTRKAYLGNNHSMVRNIYRNHFTLRAIYLLPLYKGIYIIILFIFGRLFGKILK